MSADRDIGIPQRLPALRGALLAAIVLAAPFYSGSTSALGQAVNETALLSLGIVAFGSLFWSGRGRIVFSDFELVGVALFAAAMISAAFAVFRIDAWNTVGTMLLLGIGYRAAGSEADRSIGFGRLFSIALVGSGVIQTTIATHQYFFAAWYSSAMPEFYRMNIATNMRGGVVRAVGGFINANYLAAFLNICFAVALAFALFAVMKLWQRYAFGSAAAFLLLGVFFSGSKGAMLVSAAIIVTLATLKDRRFLWAALAVLVLLVAIPNPVRDTVVRGVTADRFVQMRPAIWNSAARMFGDNALVGVGPGNFHFASHVYAPPTEFELVKYSRVPKIAHNSYLHSLAEFGLLGGVVLSILAAAVLWLVLRALLTRKRQSDPPLSVGLALGILGVFLHSMVDNVANNRAVLTTLIIIIPLLASLGAPAFFKRRRKLQIPSRRSAIVAVAATMLFAGFFVAQIIKPLAYEKQISELQSGLNEEIAALQTDERRSSEFDAASAVRGYLAKLKDLLAHYSDNPAVNRAIGNGHRALFNLEGDFSDFLDADRAFERAADSLRGRSQNDHYVRLLLRFDLTRRGYPKTEDILRDMEELASEATEHWPNRAVFQHTAAIVARERGDFAAATEHLEHAIALEPNFLQAIGDLMRLADVAGDAELFRRSEQLLSEAVKRIRSGPPAERTDEYAQTILTPPR